MKTSCNEPDYEPLRAWALHPSPVRPPGLAQLLRGGLVTWLPMAQALPVPASGERSLTHTSQCAGTPLSTLIAAMIREVLP